MDDIIIILISVWVALAFLKKARERKEKITWRHDKEFLDEIDKLNGK